MRKGDLVRLNPDLFDSFESSSSSLSLFDIKLGRCPARRPCTDKEIDNWYKSSRSGELDSAGESRLPPRTTTIYLYEDRFYTVIKARSRAMLGWKSIGGLTKVLCSFTGEEVYIKRSNLIQA